MSRGEPPSIRNENLKQRPGGGGSSPTYETPMGTLNTIIRAITLVPRCMHMCTYTRWEPQNQNKARKARNSSRTAEQS